MATHQSDLEITRLKLRLLILEHLVLRHDFAFPVMMGQQTVEESRERLLTVLEESVAVLERTFLTRPDFAGLSESERALYADEARELVDYMKSYVLSFTKRNSGAT
jgi:hypothetical protein